MRPGTARVWCVAGLACLSGLIADAQQPLPSAPAPRTQTTSPVKTGVILGRVVDASTAQPIARAIVRIDSVTAAASPPQVPMAITNARGQFVFRALPAGAFQLLVEAAGYLPGGYGKRRPDGPTRDVVVRENQTTTDAEVRLWKAAAISGMIVDETGPAVQITVGAFKRDLVRGRIVLAPVASAVSDERGIYRLHSLMPGEYLVAMATNITSIPLSASEAFWKAQEAVQPGGAVDLAQRRLMQELNAAQTSGAMGGVTVRNQQVYTYYNRPLGPTPGTDDRFLIYPTVFHPASPTPMGATVITVGSGEDRQGVNLQIAMASTFAVSGSVTGPDGPVANAPVRLVPSYTRELGSDSAFATSSTSTDAQGRFTLVGVPAGDYMVSALRTPVDANGPVWVGNGTVLMTAPASSPVPANPGDDQTLWAESSVGVADRDVDGIALALQPGFRISGRVEFVGAAPKPSPARLTSWPVNVTPSDGRSLPRMTGVPLRLAQDGTFMTPQYPPGQYVIGVFANGGDWLMKSITVDGHDGLGRAIDLSHDVKDVVVTFVDHLPTLTGTVTRAGSDADVHATVAVFPTDYVDWEATGMSAVRARLAEASPKGMFVLRNLLAGDYLVAAFDANTPVSLQDPKDITALARVATRVSVTDTGSNSISLTVSPIR